MTSRLRATVPQGVPWSSKMNWPSRRPHGPDRGDEPLRALRSVARELRKAVLPVRPRLDDHRPAGHPTDSNSTSRWISAESGSEISIRFAVRNGRSPGCSPPIEQVVDDEGAGQQAHRQPADRHLALQVVAAGLRRARTQRRTEIDRHRRDDRHRQEDGENRQEAQDPRPTRRPQPRRGRTDVGVGSGAGGSDPSMGSSGRLGWSVIRSSATARRRRPGRPRARAPRRRCPPAAREARSPSSWLRRRRRPGAP